MTQMRVLGFVLLVTFLADRTSEGTSIIYSDRAAFLAAAGQTTLTTFDEDVPCIASPFLSCTADFGPVSIAMDVTLVGSIWSFDFIPVSLFSVTGTFAQPTSMFGLDVTAAGHSGVPIPGEEPDPTRPLFAVYATGAEDPLVFVSLSGPRFIGFQSTDGTPFTGFGASPLAGLGALDNLVISVPERSSTALYVLVGMLGVASWRWRLRGKPGVA